MIQKKSTSCFNDKDDLLKSSAANLFPFPTRAGNTGSDIKEITYLEGFFGCKLDAVIQSSAICSAECKMYECKFNIILVSECSRFHSILQSRCSSIAHMVMLMLVLTLMLMMMLMLVSSIMPYCLLHKQQAVWHVLVVSPQNADDPYHAGRLHQHHKLKLKFGQYFAADV